MADRSVAWRWKALAAGCCLASSVVWLTGAGIASRASIFPSGVNRLTISRGGTGPSLRVLQLNLCDSGIGSCYSGRSVAAAAAVIHERRPDIITLNEVCRGDVSELKQAMSDSHCSTLLRPSKPRRTAPPRALPMPKRSAVRDRCLGADPVLGIRIRHIRRRLPDPGPRDPEERVWLCIHVATEVYACTTHVASSSSDVAFAQCRYLLESAAPTMRSQGGADPPRQPRREAVGRGRTGLVIEPCVRVVAEELAGYQAGVPAPARPKDAAAGSPPSPPPPRPAMLPQPGG